MFDQKVKLLRCYFHLQSRWLSKTTHSEASFYEMLYRTPKHPDITARQNTFSSSSGIWTHFRRGIKLRILNEKNTNYFCICWFCVTHPSTHLYYPNLQQAASSKMDMNKSGIQFLFCLNFDSSVKINIFKKKSKS